MKKMAKFKITYSTPKVGSAYSFTAEIDDEDLATMSEMEINECLFEDLTQRLSWDYEKIED